MLLIKAHELHDKKDTNNIHVHTPFWKVCLQLMLIFMWRQCEKIIKIHSYHETFFETLFLHFHTFTCSYFSSYQFNNTQSIFLIFFLHLYKLKINCWINPLVWKILSHFISCVIHNNTCSWDMILHV